MKMGCVIFTSSLYQDTLDVGPTHAWIPHPMCLGVELM